MASGRLGTADLAATTITDVYTVPASTLTSCNINICNRNATAIAIRIAVSDTTVTQGVDEFLVYDKSISANDSAQITANTLDATKIITAYSDTANVSIVVMGIEEAV